MASVLEQFVESLSLDVLEKCKKVDLLDIAKHFKLTSYFFYAQA